MKTIKLSAKDLPGWRSPRKRASAFESLLKATFKRLEYLRTDLCIPGNETSGERWIRKLHRLEKARLKMRGEIVPNSVSFKVLGNKQLEYVGYDSRYRIWPQWFGLNPEVLDVGNVVIISL